MEKGPGWARNDGSHIVGLALGVDGGGRWYFPMKHTVEPEYNMDPVQVMRFAKSVLTDSRPKVGANLLYDYGCLQAEGITLGGALYDVQFAEALLNSEAPNVSLENLSEKYLGFGKETNILYQWLSDYYGGPPTDKQRANIYRATPRLVGPYGESDADRPIHVMNAQWPRLVEWGLLDLFHMECKLIPILTAMRARGVEVDIPYVEQLRDEFAADIDVLDEQIRDMVGFGVNVNASKSIAKAFDELGLSYPIIAKTGNPSFVKDYLEAHPHPLAQLIVERRGKDKLRSTFLESYLLNGNVNGKVHCQFHPLRNEGRGARSGRFSSSTPNLQNIPIRSADGKRIRRAFKALGRRWRKFDYSQIEYRLLAHHAVGPGSDEIRYKYMTAPETDYHVATQELVKLLTGLDIARSKIKNVNFGFIYGMSQKKLASMLALAAMEAAELFKAYHAAVPFAKKTAKHYSDMAESLGYVATFGGRRSQFTKFVPYRYFGSDDDNEADNDPIIPLDLAPALAKYGRVSRAFTHKALNRVLQGGAADIMKRAMVQAYEAGVFAHTGLPLLTVHDELDFDDFGELDDPAWRELVNIMEKCAPEVTIPIRVDHECGPTWGQVEEYPLAA